MADGLWPARLRLALWHIAYGRKFISYQLYAISHPQGLFEIRDHMLAPQVDRVHHFLMGNSIGLHVTQELFTAGFLIALHFLNT